MPVVAGPYTSLAPPTAAFTSAATKDLLAKAALTSCGGLALWTIMNSYISDKNYSVNAYLLAHTLDILINRGAATQGLIRLNPQPLLSNINWITSWVR